MLGGGLRRVFVAYLGAYLELIWEHIIQQSGSVSSGAIGCVLDSMLGSVLENVLGGVHGSEYGVYLRAW